MLNQTSDQSSSSKYSRPRNSYPDLLQALLLLRRIIFFVSKRRFFQVLFETMVMELKKKSSSTKYQAHFCISLMAKACSIGTRCCSRRIRFCRQMLFRAGSIPREPRNQAVRALPLRDASTPFQDVRRSSVLEGWTNSASAACTECWGGSFQRFIKTYPAAPFSSTIPFFQFSTSNCFNYKIYFTRLLLQITR